MLLLWVAGDRAFWHLTSGMAADLPLPSREAEGKSVRQVRAVLPTPWLFERRGLVSLAGERVALYDGWCPAGAARTLFRLPGQADPTWVTLQPDETVRVAVP